MMSGQKAEQSVSIMGIKNALPIVLSFERLQFDWIFVDCVAAS